MKPRLSVLVAGLGAMGSAVALGLARRGARVTAFDAHRPPHRLGSSHGESRIIREAYFEDPAYVPLVRLAYEAWGRLERDTERRLLLTTGALTIGPRDGRLVTGAAESARIHEISHEILDAAGLRARYPHIQAAAGSAAVHERRGGILLPEACIEASLREAVRHGAELRFEERVTGWADSGRGVRLETTAGTHEADLLVLTAGAWLPGMLPELPLTLERQVMTWWRPRGAKAAFLPDSMPVFVWETEGQEMYYGVPDLGSGLKAARHHSGRTVDAPDELERDVGAGDVEPVREFLDRHLAGAAGELRKGEVCIYTNAPGSRFLLDHHPAAPATFVVSACSGHGFKFASAIGESVATRLTGGQPQVDLTAFSWPAAEGG